jgi:hypothetical protein
MLQSKLSAFFSLLLVFLSGALVGGFADRLYNTTGVSSTKDTPAPRTKGPGQRMDPEERRKALVEEMRKEVKLDDQQVEQLQHIYDNTREQFMQLNQKRNSESHALWDNQTSQIKSILRPDQVSLFEALRAKHEAERDAYEKAHKKGPPGGKK